MRLVSVGQVLSAIKKLTDNPVTRLVNTHADGDHVFGNRFQPAGVTFIAHENCLKEFFAPSMNGTPSDWNNPSLEEVQKQFEQNQSALVQTIYNEIK